MATHDPTATDLDALLGGDNDWRRFLPWAGGIALLIIAALTTYLLTSGSDTVAAVEPEPTQATTGSITSTTSLSGTAATAQAADLTFGSAGVVATVDVAVGDPVSAGDVLATLDNTEAARQLETAQISLDQAEASLAELLSDPDAADLAAAIQSLRSAESQVASSELSLDRLLEPAAAADVLAAEQAVANAISQLSTAEAALADLREGPTDADVASAQASVASAESQLANATLGEQTSFGALDAAQNAYCAFPEGLADLCATWALPLSAENIGRLEASEADASTFLIATIDPFIQASVAYEGALASLEAATASLESATARLEDAQAAASPDALFRAEQSVTAARNNYDVAVLRLEELKAGAEAIEVDQAQTSLASAQASLTSAQARYADLVGGADVTDIERAQQSVRLAEIGLERAQEGLEDVQVIARFDGVVGAVNVGVGDQVTANTVAISVNTPERIVIDLTVSEAEVLDLAVGQVGLATFDAVGDTQYPVRVTSISTIPTVASGVVTYAVEAVILEVGEIAEVTADLQALATGGGATDFAALAAAAGGGGFGGAADGSALRGDGTGRAAGGQAGGAGPAGLLGDIELPEGVTIQDVFAALAAGEDLPAGIELPEGFELPAGFADRLAGGGAGTGTGAGLATLADENRQLPLAGMSGSVEILLGTRDDVLLVPSSAVRAQGSTSYVVIENDEGEFERLTVVTGESSGANVEVVSGLEPGATVWLNASAPASEDFSLQNVDVSQPDDAQQPPAGFPPGGFGGGGGGGGGGGRGGAQ